MASSNGGRRRWKQAPELWTGQGPEQAQHFFGVVKTIKGHYGFITSLNHGDVFFLMEELSEDLQCESETNLQGKPVQFEVTMSKDNRVRAVNVKPVPRETCSYFGKQEKKKSQWFLPHGRKRTGALSNLIAGHDSGDNTASVAQLDSIMRYEADNGSLVVLDAIGLGEAEIDQNKVIASIQDVALSAPNGVNCLLYVMKNDQITDAAIARGIFVAEYLCSDEALQNLHILVTHSLVKDRTEADSWIQSQCEIKFHFKRLYSIVGYDPDRFIFVDRRSRRDSLCKLFCQHCRDAVAELTKAERVALQQKDIALWAANEEYQKAQLAMQVRLKEDLHTAAQQHATAATQRFLQDIRKLEAATRMLCDLGGQLKTPHAAAKATTVTVPNNPRHQPDGEEVPAADNCCSAGYSDTHEGVAMGNLEATGPTMIRVREGDTIEVLETHHAGWSYAKNLSRSSPPGLVPSGVEASNRDEDPGHVAAVAPAPAASSVMQPTQTAVASPTPVPPQHVSAKRNFTSGSDAQMSVSVGESVWIVVRKQNDWSFGRKVVNGVTVSGWIPFWACFEEEGDEEQLIFSVTIDGLWRWTRKIILQPSNDEGDEMKAVTAMILSDQKGLLSQVIIYIIILWCRRSVPQPWYAAVEAADLAEALS
eukprot:symbB.v1.2.020090.t1/scaffold1672.1/size106478/2